MAETELSVRERDDLLGLLSEVETPKLHEALRSHIGVLVLFRGRPAALESIEVMRMILDELERRERADA